MSHSSDIFLLNEINLCLNQEVSMELNVHVHYCMLDKCVREAMQQLRINYSKPTNSRFKAFVLIHY